MTPDLITTAKGLTNGAVPISCFFAAKDLRRVHAGSWRILIEPLFMATPTQRTRSPARRPWRPRTSMRKKAC